MNKTALLQEIINTLEADLLTLTVAAKTAHAAATHDECAPDNKYDTTALEASYIAQGQANRAQEIRSALADYRNLELHDFCPDSQIRLTALTTLEADDGTERIVFLGPAAGGLRISIADQECVVITPEAPLGRALLGKCCDDEIQLGKSNDARSYLIIDLC
jgi:transcription elongation GreA/GreB family factor